MHNTDIIRGSSSLPIVLERLILPKRREQREHDMQALHNIPLLIRPMHRYIKQSQRHPAILL
jgi:hypothetical protein